MSTENRDVYTPAPGEREKYIGASDVAAIIGISPWRTPFDVWAEKTGRLNPESKDKEIFMIGRLLEPVILDWAEMTLGPIERTIDPIVGNYGFPLVGHLDGRCLDTGYPVEAKSSGMKSPLNPIWGEEGTDEVPEYVIVQTLIQIALTSAEMCHVPAFLGGRGPKMYRVAANPTLQDQLINQSGDFWWKYVKTNTKPPDSLPTIEVAKRMIRQPVTVGIPPDLLRDYIEKTAAATQAAKVKAAAQAEIFGALGDAECGTAEGVGTVTYREQSRRAYEVPEATFRVMRIKKTK